MKKFQVAVLLIGMVVITGSTNFTTAAVAVAQANPISPKFHTFQHPHSTFTIAIGVSNTNIVVGQYEDFTSVRHGYLLANGKFTNIDDPNNGSVAGTVPTAVNSSGTVVGWYYDSQDNAHGFSYANGAFTEVGPPGAAQSDAYGINDEGQMTGDFLDTDNVWKGWIFDGTTYQTVFVPGSLYSAVSGVNVHGMAAVWWIDTSDNTEASLYDGKTFTTIDVPGAVNSFPNAIDLAGDVVYGWTGSDPNGVHAALLSKGKYTKADGPGCTRTNAGGINDHHVIVGYCQQATATVAYYVIY